MIHGTFEESLTYYQGLTMSYYVDLSHSTEEGPIDNGERPKIPKFEIHIDHRKRSTLKVGIATGPK